MNLRVDDLLAMLVEGVTERRWCTGFQVCVIVGGVVIVDEGYGRDGLGRDVAQSSLFPIYCAGKPLTALTIGRLVDDGELSFDDVLGDVVDRPLHPGLRPIRLDQLLAHTAGLWAYRPEVYLASDALARDQLVRSSVPLPQDPRFGIYSEFVSWELLRYAIEDVTGLEFETVLNRQILKPLQLDEQMAFTIGSNDPRLDRLRINVDLRRQKATPLVWEQHPANLADLRVAGGAHASMNGLAHLYAHLLDIEAGHEGFGLTRRTLRQMTAAATVAAHDQVLGRVCRHARGFMPDLSHHCHDARHSQRSFGHSGLHGMTFAAADPETGLAYAVHLNGATAFDSDVDPDRSPQERRRLISGRILDLVA